MRLLVKAFVVLAVTAMIQTKRLWDMELIKADVYPPDNGYFISTIRIKRIRQGVYGFNGSVTLARDIDNSISIETRLFYSKLANNQYTMSPLKIDRADMYVMLNKYYKKFMMKDIAKFSNFPQVSEDEVFDSPVAKGDYYLKDYEFDYDNFPLPSYLPYGNHKVVAMMRDEADGKDFNFLNFTLETKITPAVKT